MPLIQYDHKMRFSPEKLAMLAFANDVLAKFNAQGLDCTLRQLYYQFVAGDRLPNTVKSYNMLGNLISDGRMAGLVDWDLIVDRTRNVASRAHWDRPSAIVASVISSYAMDRWDNQNYYLEVWVEKDALRGVVQKACYGLDVSHFSCRGYTSMSEAWAASQRLLVAMDKGKKVVILHVGDHDPSGIDMTRDIIDRLAVFTRSGVQVDRLALNMDQVERYNLIPNPAKVTDSRFESYRERFGDESWELDALDPATLVELIERGIKRYLDPVKWEQSAALEERGKDTLRYAAQYWPDVVKFLRDRRLRDDSPVVCTGCLATQANPRCLCHDTERPIAQLAEEY